MADVITLRHAVADHHLTYLRDRDTPPPRFRQSVRVLATLLAAEATKDLPAVEATISTPLEQTQGRILAGRSVVVPILRAGLAMVDPLLNLIPDCEVRHLGLYRDEQTANPVWYYEKLPGDNPADRAFLLDPMLATGGSAVEAVKLLLQWGVREIRMLAILAAPEGVRRVQFESPRVQVFVGALDRGLNDQKFIVPGLGDAGDRIFNT